MPILDPTKQQQALTLINGLERRFRNQLGLEVSPEFVAEANQTLDEIAKLFAN